MTNYKQYLKELKLAYIEKNYPSFFDLSGKYKMKIKPYDDSTANGLTNCIQDFVKHVGGYCNRTSTTGMMRKIKGEMRWTKGRTNKGAFDLRIVYQGKSIDVEVKIGKDKMSEAQIREQARILAAGGFAFVATSFPAFLEFWQSIGFEVPQLKQAA